MRAARGQGWRCGEGWFGAESCGTPLSPTHALLSRAHTHTSFSHTHSSLAHTHSSLSHTSLSHSSLTRTHTSLSHTLLSPAHSSLSHTHTPLSHTHLSLTHSSLSHTHPSLSHIHIRRQGRPTPKCFGRSATKSRFTIKAALQNLTACVGRPVAPPVLCFLYSEPSNGFGVSRGARVIRPTNHGTHTLLPTLYPLSHLMWLLMHDWRRFFFLGFRVWDHGFGFVGSPWAARIEGS